MKRNRLISLPGGLTILGGTTPILKQGHNEHVDLLLEDFDFASYDVQTGVLTITNSQPQVRVFHEQYHFTQGKAGSLYFNVGSDMEHLALIEAVVSNVVKDFPVDEAKVGIVLTELIHNAMQVAEERSQHKDIQVALLYVPTFGMFLSVTDELGRLNLEELPGSFLDESGEVSLECHGRGLLIIAELMEWLAYNPCATDEGCKEILICVPMRTLAEQEETHA